MFALEPEREFDFLQFALQRAILRQKQILGELLGQRRAALRNTAMQDIRDRRARDADRIDAVMRIEPPILDGDERLRQIGRQVFQCDIGAGHFAARRQHAAVEADDLDRRRPLRNFKRLDCRQMRAGPDDDADQRDRGPEAEHRAPVKQPIESGPRARLRAPLAVGPARTRLSFARRFVLVVGIADPASRRRFSGCLILADRNAILRAKTQLCQRGAEPELRLLASALFPCPRHTPTPTSPDATD